MSWFRLARRGAAYELGRRLWAWFLAIEIIKFAVRRVLPVVLILAALAAAVGLGIRTSAWWLPRLTALAVIAATLTVAVWLARRYRWELRAGLPCIAVAVVVLGVVGVLTGFLYWLR